MNNLNKLLVFHKVKMKVFFINKNKEFKQAE